MYLADYHTHSTCSEDGNNTMTEMALAAVGAGMQEICLTDHIDVVNWLGEQKQSHDWSRAREQYAQAREMLDGQIIIRLGAELGQATEDFSRAERIMSDAPPLDFVIGSLHNQSWEYGRKDFCTIEEADEMRMKRAISTYLDEMLELARWGQFNVIGHLTLPLRYFNENLGMNLSFAPYEEQVRAVFETIIPKGIGIELNTNRGHTPLPDRDILCIYREMGGEIITLGSDAHTPEYVGCCIRERQRLLRGCGFERFFTFEKGTPIAHELSA